MVAPPHSTTGVTVSALFVILLYFNTAARNKLLANALASGNEVLGDPYVDCGLNHIKIRVDTRSTFKGLLFVEGHLDEPECRSAPSADLQQKTHTNGIDDTSAASTAHIRLGFKDCGIQRKRVSSPTGILLTLNTTLVVAFHRGHLTKSDRVYRIQCFYMEMERVLEKEIIVRMPPPVVQTKQVEMPVCKYEVLDGGPDGPSVFYATVGQPVYHKWSCESADQGVHHQFCMIVHSCTVDDGNGDRVELIDSKGCARDKYLLQNLDYVSDLLVGKEAHVYKYADRPNVFFDCKITLSVKEPGQEYCDVPHCPDPPRRRRSRPDESELIIDSNGVVQKNASADSPFIITKGAISKKYRNNWIEEHFNIIGGELCLSTAGSTFFAIVNALMMVMSCFLLRNVYRVARRNSE